MKMLLINSIVGSDTKTLTPDEDLQSYFVNQYKNADASSNEMSWDNEYRNIYSAVKHDENLIKSILDIPERTRIVRKKHDVNVSVSFAKRGNGVLFAIANENDSTATIAAPEQVLDYFKADLDEESYCGDDSLESRFEILREKIMAPHPLPKIEGRRAEALKIVEFLIDNYPRERDYLIDLYETIKTYDDLSDGELKYIAQLQIGKDDFSNTVNGILKKFPVHYINVIKERAEAIDRVSEIIMFTEDIRK